MNSNEKPKGAVIDWDYWSWIGLLYVPSNSTLGSFLANTILVSIGRYTTKSGSILEILQSS